MDWIIFKKCLFLLVLIAVTLRFTVNIRWPLRQKPCALESRN